MPLRIDTRRDDARTAVAALRARLSPRGNIVSEAGRRLTVEVFGEALAPQQVVERICVDVRDRGLAAVLEYSAKIDKAELTAATIRVSAEELAAAHAAADPALLACVRRVRENILAFQTAILHRNVRVERPGGVVLEQRYVPLRRVGVCVPGGAAAYPSTVLMTVVPAQAAGVEQLAVVAPPTKFGAYNKDLLAVCHELGVREVYRLGGAQAVAALAFGVGEIDQGIEQVDKIVGPGNLFVALAKKFVFGEVDIDSIAGPSEIVIVADETASPEFCAADMLAQAEHAPGSSVLISWSERLIDETATQLERQLAGLARGELAAASLNDFGALVLVRDADEAAQLATEFAPEHLHLACADADAMVARIPTAGAVFVGPFTTVALGDYVAGPSHVLPTGGTGRFSSGLSANSFLRSHSVIRYTKEALAAAADDLRLLAEYEGLTAHRDSALIRLRE
ncbi:MAG: histidinol dehydrogenase [Pirellulales bacterium]